LAVESDIELIQAGDERSSNEATQPAALEKAPCGWNRGVTKGFFTF